jgi:diguanylate cyclase (GGDEF)-like protein
MSKTSPSSFERLPPERRQRAEPRRDASVVQQSFDKRLSRRLTLAIACTVALALTVIAPTCRAFMQARDNLRDIEHYRMILDAAIAIAAERGPANDAMAQGASSQTPIALRLADFRDRSNAALARLAGTRDPEAPGVLSDMLAEVCEQLASARTKVDRVAALPRDKLTRDAFQDAVESMFAASNTFRNIVARTADDLGRRDEELAAPAIVGQILSDFRDYGGRIASQIMAPIATRERLPLQNMIDSRQTQGRLLELWLLMKSQPNPYDNPTLAAQRAEIQLRFLGDGLHLLDEMIEQGASGDTYSLTTAEFTARFIPTMAPIEAYRRAFLDAVVAKHVDAKTSALAKLAAVGVVTSAILAILVGVILSIRIHIFRPLFDAYEHLLRLAEDRPPARQQQPAKAGEIRNLFGALALLQDKIEQRTSMLRAEADTDGLTGLLNRRAFERLAAAQPGLKTATACLILIDVDRFKDVNDNYGHPTGDRVLRQTADLLRSRLRASDIVARFGGEEFAILLPATELSEAIGLARKLRIAIQCTTFATPGGTSLGITASLGIASSQRGPEGWPSLIEHADAALYRAKSDGRNRVRFAKPDAASGATDVSRTTCAA